MAVLYDPRDPELVTWLSGLAPREEFVARMALRGLCERCRRDRAWRARIHELQRRLCPDAESLSAMLASARAMAAEIERQVAYGLDADERPA